jgi:ribonucleotide reductase alpha subunit
MNTIYNLKKDMFNGGNQIEILGSAVDALRKLELEETSGGVGVWINLDIASRYTGLPIQEILYVDLNPNHSLIYSETGCHILKTRYLQRRGKLLEPIQIMHLRVALYMKPKNLEELQMFYTAFSCGFLLISSTMNDASIETLSSGRLVVGDACKLVCPSTNNDQETALCLFDAMKHCILGSGLGICGSALPLNGQTGYKKIQNSLDNWAEVLSSATKINLNDRKSKIAIYVAVHCNTLESFLQYKSVQQGKLNFMVGVMIPDYFIEQFKKGGNWHFFDASVRFQGKCLHEYWGSNYQKAYEFLVSQRLYSEVTTAKLVMQKLINSIKTSGQPYIIWSDKVNRYNNNRSLGTIKTLNLCAEITNSTHKDEFSSCVLLSCSPFYFHQFPLGVKMLYNWCREYVKKFLPLDFLNVLEARGDRNLFLKTAFIQGCLGTICLNNILPENDRCRQIGLSPVGLFDCSVLLGLETDQVCEEYSEALYLGAVLGSLAVADKNPQMKLSYKTEFNNGELQFSLRKETPRLQIWNHIQDQMRKYPMANSMLTAQAPTSTTANLLDVCESIQLPVSRKFTLQHSTKRNVKIPLGFIHLALNNCKSAYKYDVENQLNLYKITAKYVDHSQSTIYNIDCTVEAIKKVLVQSYNLKLKTGMYYCVFNNTNKSIKASECESCTM